MLYTAHFVNPFDSMFLQWLTQEIGPHRGCLYRDNPTLFDDDIPHRLDLRTCHDC